jgi:hypothetical protein
LGSFSIQLQARRQECFTSRLVTSASTNQDITES